MEIFFFSLNILILLIDHVRHFILSSIFVHIFSNISTSDLLGSFIGTIGAFLIAIWEIRQHRKNEDKRDSQLFLNTMNRIHNEVDMNIANVRELKKVLISSRNSRKDIWDVSLKIVDAISVRTYENLLGLGLIRLIPNVEERDLTLAYDGFYTLKDEVRKAAVSHDFNLSYKGSQELANVERDRVLGLIEVLMPLFNKVKDAVKVYSN